ncbi:MAG: acyl-ACP--UDP-N-acetylglucosamine O-acyltransferase [Opitutae bacterium]|nr:acyl-ACP--UDP-N-acetylglucosamine O-acyltransferase [Opitutae bacterium]
MNIHPTAIIEEDVQLGAGCVVQAHAIIRRHTVLGPGVVVHPFAVIGGDPQYLKFDPATVSHVRVGAGTVIREHVTINRSIHAGQATMVGERCFLMASAHVAHDCAVGDDVVLANNVLLAGHVSVGNNSFVGGGAGVHQFTRVGEGAIVSGLARLAQDVPPFAMAAERNEIIGLNLIGLKRRGISRDTIREIKDAFRAVYFTPGNIREVARGALEGGRFQTAEARQFLTFFTEGKRGFARARRDAAAGDGDAG